MAEVKGPERTKQMVALLEHWQEIEKKGIESVSAIMDKTTNPVVRQFMEIIRNDSGQHHRVQRFIIDTLTTQTISLTPEELADIWDAVEAHLKLEMETVELAKKLRDDCRFFVQKELLEYLLMDEEKHTKMLQQLENFKKKMYPYG